MNWPPDRISVARFVFALDTVLGIFSIGAGALYASTYSSSGNYWVAALTIFVPCAVLWTLFCYGAYKGLTSSNKGLNVLFWVIVVGNAIGFPVGTAIAGAYVWLWRELAHMRKMPA